MMKERFDLIVIGGGSAARDGAGKAAREHGARVALVEKERWGGSCPNVACSPTKAYLVASELTHDVNVLAPSIGIETGPARVDLGHVYAWKETLKKAQDVWKSELMAQRFTTYSGTATFAHPPTVRIGDIELESERILIASGSRTAVPPIEGIEEVGWIDHISALDLTEVPASLLVVGAGAVGLEFGQIFARFGSKVTIVDALDRIAPIADMFGAGGPAADYSVLPTSIFTDPELGSVGMTEEQAREQGLDVDVARNEYVKRFSFIGERAGLFKIVYERGSRRVLGLHVLSRNAGDIVQGFSLGLRLGATVDDLAAMHHVFPTFGEGIKAAAEL